MVDYIGAFMCVHHVELNNQPVKSDIKKCCNECRCGSKQLCFKLYPCRS